MKRITCEMCGGNDIIKKDGVFVCNSCGTKYSIEEARKLMVEVSGTVKIDNSDRVQKLYQAARQARSANDYVTAEATYTKIAQEDPTSWEAHYYIVYCRAMQSSILGIESAARAISNSFESTLNIIANNVKNKSEKQKAIQEICNSTTKILKLLEASARNSFAETYEEGWASNNEYMFNGATNDYVVRNTAIYEAFLSMGDNIAFINRKENDEKIQRLAVQSWKNGIQYFIDISLIFDDWRTRPSMINNEYGVKVRKSQSGYSVPSPNTNGFPPSFLWLLKKKLHRLF